MELVQGVSHEYLLHVARRMVGALDAEDVVQNAYLRAHRAASRFRAECAPQTWMHRITTRCALDLLRKRKRRPEMPIPASWIRGTTPEQPAYTSEPVGIEGVVRVARERMNRLPRREKEALLAVTRHASYADAAAALGLTVPTFRRRLDHARARLRRMQ